MKLFWPSLAVLVSACGAQEHFVYSPADPDSTVMAIFDVDGELPQIRQGAAQDALRFDLAPGLGRIYLAAYAPERQAQDGSPISECAVEIRGEAPAFVEPDEVFVTPDFNTELAPSDWQAGELPDRLTLRNRDCQVLNDPCAGIIVETIPLPPEHLYTAIAGVLPDTVIVGGEIERGEIDDPIALQVEDGNITTVEVPRLGQGYVKDILPLSDDNWMGLTGYGGRLWQSNPQDGTSQLFDLQDGFDIAGVPGGPILVRTSTGAFLANPVRELVIPEVDTWMQDIFVSPDVAYVSTERALYRVNGDQLVVEPTPPVLTDRLHFGGDDEVVVGVGSLQEIILRDLPDGDWRKEPRPFDQFERFFTVTGAGGGRYVIGGSSMVAVHTERGFCRFEYPRQEFKKLARTRSGVVYALATDARELVRLELPPLDQ